MHEQFYVKNTTSGGCTNNAASVSCFVFVFVLVIVAYPSAYI